MITVQHTLPIRSSNLIVNTPGDHEAPCPTCNLYFSKLDDSPSNGVYSQHVVVMERGEPKSGTGIAFERGVGALSRTCTHFKEVLGGEGCSMEFKTVSIRHGKDVRSSSFTFVPRKGCSGRPLFLCRGRRMGVSEGEVRADLSCVLRGRTKSPLNGDDE